MKVRRRCLRSPARPGLPEDANPGRRGRAARDASLSNAEAICGTWVLQQVASRAELDRLLPQVLAPALATPGVRGFSLRVPWRAIDADFALLEAGLAVAHERGLAFSVRFMAGRHTPARVFAAGCPSYRHRGEPVPVPFFPDGSPNTVFEAEYERFVARLAGWCRATACGCCTWPGTARTGPS